MSNTEVDKVPDGTHNVEFCFQTWANNHGVAQADRQLARSAFFGGWMMRHLSKSEILGKVSTVALTYAIIAYTIYLFLTH